MTVGSRGDVNPFLGIAHRLQQDGHPVRLIATPHFAPAAAAAGVPFVAIGQDTHEREITDPRLFDPRRGGAFAFRVRLEGIAAADEALRAAWRERKPAAVLGNPLCLGLRWACEETGVPLLLAHLAPMTLLSRADPVPALQKRPGRVARTAARWTQPLMQRVVSGLVQRELAPLRAARGLPPQQGLLARESFGGVETLGLWSPAVRGPQRDDPPNTHICGFSWWDGGDGETLPAGLEEFLASGPPPICFALGSSVAWQPGDFYEQAIAASAALGTRALLLTQDRRGVPAHVPAGTFVASYVPYSRVLPRVRAFVHHGGIGTTAQGLRAGVPALVVPRAHDQFNNGLRVTALQAGRMVRRSQLTPDRLVRELGALLHDPALLAGTRALAAALRDEDGAAGAAQRVSAVASRMSR